MTPIDLNEHPEGGRFREVFRSNARVMISGGEFRSALTHIYFSLDLGEVSRFHRVTSDEVWNLYQGHGLRLYTWDGSTTQPICTVLSAESNTFCLAVSAGTWQAAEPIGDSVLVGCSVAPGFEFHDFELLEPDSDLASLLQSIDRSWLRFIDPSTSDNSQRIQ
jgi:predicted cupin superfamily sugar epimerase